MSVPADVRCLRVGLLQECCYILSRADRDDCLVIDPGSDADRILEAVRPRKIVAILLTHGHFDHIGAVSELWDGKAEIIIHEADAPLLLDPYLNASWMLGPPVVSPAATRTVREGDHLDLAGIGLEVLHTPGHTAGSVCYRMGDVLFSGDTIMAGGYGRTDLPGGNEEYMEASLRRLAPLARSCTLCGGH